MSPSKEIVLISYLSGYIQCLFLSIKWVIENIVEFKKAIKLTIK
jgi:hypothetical protein